MKMDYKIHGKESLGHPILFQHKKQIFVSLSHLFMTSKVLEAEVHSTLLDFIRNKTGEDEFTQDVHNYFF